MLPSNDALDVAFGKEKLKPASLKDGREGGGGGGITNIPLSCAVMSKEARAAE